MLNAIIAKVVTGLVTLVISTTSITSEAPTGNTTIPDTGSQESIVVTQDDYSLASFLLVDMPPVLPYVGGAGVVLALAYGVANEKDRKA